ncbi:MAG TPA: TonB-dependent receptor, partial [Flavobacteriales bacterium]|nr:TonB-dependent receptor [Flavobacteriales bacterium]
QQPGVQDTMRFALTNARATFASAKDSSRLHYELGTDVNVETGAGDRIGGGSKEIGDYAAFASAEYRATDRITLRPGARFAYNTRYGAPLIPSVNVRWRLGERFTLRGSYAQGFRAPSLKELYMVFVDVNHDITGNTDLRAERSQSSALGVTYKKDDGKLILTGEVNSYYNDVRDLITLAQRSGASFNYVNIGRLRTAGGSVGLGIEQGGWSASIGASLLMRKDALAAVGDPWFTTPELRGSITRAWEKKGWSASLFIKHQGEQVNYSTLVDGTVQRGSISSFNLADATISKQLWNKRVTVSGGCKDLFNVQNIAASMSSGVHDAGATSVPLTTGRTVFLKLELDLKRGS